MINRDDNPKNLPNPQKTYRTPNQKTYRPPKKPTEPPKNLSHPVRICNQKNPYYNPYNPYNP